MFLILNFALLVRFSDLEYVLRTLRAGNSTFIIVCNGLYYEEIKPQRFS